MQLPVFPLLGIYSKERVGQVHQDVRVRPCHCYSSETGNTRMSSVRTGQLPALYLALSINIKHAKVSPQLCSPKGSPVAFASQPNFLQRPLHFPPLLTTQFPVYPPLPLPSLKSSALVPCCKTQRTPSTASRELLTSLPPFSFRVPRPCTHLVFAPSTPLPLLGLLRWLPSLCQHLAVDLLRDFAPGLPSHSPTASRRQPGFSSASSTPEELMFLTRAPSLAADWTHCLNVTCFSDSEYPNLHSPYPLSQWHHCLPKTNVNVGFSLPSI